MTRFKTLLALTLAALPGTGAAQDLITPANPLTIVSAIRDEGYKAQLSEDGQGNPKIEGRIQRSNYSIFFYDCDDPQGCSSLQFSAGYDLEAGWTPEAANDWNRDWRYGRALLDDNGDPYLRMDVNMDGGVSAANFADTFDIWTLLVDEFEQAIEW